MLFVFFVRTDIFRRISPLKADYVPGEQEKLSAKGGQVQSCIAVLTAV